MFFQLIVEQNDIFGEQFFCGMLILGWVRLSKSDDGPAWPGCITFRVPQRSKIKVFKSENEGDLMGGGGGSYATHCKL